MSSMGTEPVCSVCIANYNGNDVLRECLDSVYAQDCGFAIEVIVHDDASTDGSAEIVARDYPSARLIRSQRNVGFCVANNRMVAAARGEYILLLNNDAALFPDALRHLYAAAQKMPACILGLPQYEAGSGALLDRGSLLDPFFNPVPNLDPERTDVAMVMGACLWIPRQLWDSLGGFPDWFGSIAEDMYLCCAARLSAYPVRVLPRSGFRHHVGQSFGGGKAQRGKLVTSQRRRALSERNKCFVMVTALPLPLLVFWLPIHLCLLLAEGVVLAAFRRSSTLLWAIYVDCVRQLWANRKELSELRRRTQGGKHPASLRFFSAFTLTPQKLRLLHRHGLPTINT